MTAAGKAYTGAQYGSGTGPVVLSNIQCDASDDKLFECQSGQILSNNCTHEQDAGAQCEGQCSLLNAHRSN